MKTKCFVVCILTILLFNIPLLTIANNKHISNDKTYFEYNKTKRKAYNDDQIVIMYKEKANDGLILWGQRSKEIESVYTKLLKLTDEEFQKLQYDRHSSYDNYEFTDEGKADFRSNIILDLKFSGYLYPEKYDDNLFNFLLYIVDNEPSIKLTNEYIDAVKFYAWNGHEIAKNYLRDKLNDPNQYLSIKLHLHAINLTFRKDEISYEFLKDQIIKSQNVVTTDVAFYSPIESIIYRWIREIPGLRYNNNQEYDDIVELIGLLMKSRCKGIQDYVNVQFSKLVQLDYIQNRITELWNIIDNPSCSRREYLDALYELTAYKMLKTERYPKQFKPDLQKNKMTLYMQELVKPRIILGEPIWFDINNSEINEDRINDEEKIYFYERTKFYPYGQDVDHEKYKLDEPLFREIGGAK
jgi:hypothetical protein